MKLVLSLAAVTILGLGPAVAQQAPAQPDAGVAGVAGDLRDIGDMHVIGAGGEDIGEIEDVLVDSTGQVVAVSVEAGGFLGMGDRDVIMRLDVLEPQGDGFTTTMTQEQIEALPDWDDDD